MEFYFQEALSLLREQPAAYDGFDKETVRVIAENQKSPVSSIYIARNLRTTVGVLEISPEKGTTPAKYKFTTVIPTDRQVQYAHQAMEEFGISRFSIIDITRKITSIHPEYRVLPLVAEAIFTERREEWALRIASHDPLQYQKVITPAITKAATVNLKETRLM